MRAFEKSFLSDHPQISVEKKTTHLDFAFQLQRQLKQKNRQDFYRSAVFLVGLLGVFFFSVFSFRVPFLTLLGL